MLYTQTWKVTISLSHHLGEKKRSQVLKSATEIIPKPLAHKI